MRIDADGVGIDVEISGDGDPVVLLHGFPDSGRLWRHQVPALVEAGHQVIVPDLRGYGSSDKPTEVEAYSIPVLGGDVVAILDQLGIDRASIVGHDWGAALAWALGTYAADRVEKLAVLSVGHPEAFVNAGMEQRRKSWYMLLFLFEGIAERWLTMNDWANFREFSHHPDLDAVIVELEKNGSLTPGLNWYRANLPPAALVEGPPEGPPVSAPTMGLWSTGDFALTEAQMANSGNYVTGPWRYERLEGVSHWMQLEAPERINQLLVEFLG